MSRLPLAAACVAIAIAATAAAQDAVFPPEQVKRGAEVYALNCSPCHGPRLYGEESAFDLRTFPRGERERFITSVTRGKNQMPPWGGLIKPEEIEALWAYVATGESP
jgi:mono/diheme cytochrome c family protein